MEKGTVIHITIVNDKHERHGDEGMPVDEMENGCPVATQNIDVNLENRQKAIEDYGYGPLNPYKVDPEFWQDKADLWGTSMERTKGSRCLNCAAFNQTTKILECISEGIGTEGFDDPYDVIEAGDLGYCQFLKFKCASKRKCDAWVGGGPITDEKMEID